MFCAVVDWLFGWLSVSFTSWLAGYVVLKVGWLAGLLTGRLAGLLTGWLAGWLADRLAGCSLRWLAGRFFVLGNKGSDKVPRWRKGSKLSVISVLSRES